MPDYTRHFTKFMKTKKVKDLKTAINMLDDDWEVRLVGGLGFREGVLIIQNVDVSYSGEIVQIQLTDVGE